MIIQIIGFIVCLIAASSYLSTAKHNKNSREPIAFWTGDKSVKYKVKGMYREKYNQEMAALYKKYGHAIIMCGAGFLIYDTLGLIMTSLTLSLGMYIVHRKYKEILAKYS